MDDTSSLPPTIQESSQNYPSYKHFHLQVTSLGAGVAAVTVASVSAVNHDLTHFCSMKWVIKTKLPGKTRICTNISVKNVFDVEEAWFMTYTAASHQGATHKSLWLHFCLYLNWQSMDGGWKTVLMTCNEHREASATPKVHFTKMNSRGLPLISALSL